MNSDKTTLLTLPDSGSVFFRHTWMHLLCMYLLSVLIRFLLAFFFRQMPTIYIDESLYINIAKSLAAGEGIAYRSQPVPYMYIFYPLLLVPIYLFPLPFDLYRVVQLFNALLISSSLFPVYLFAKDFSGSYKKAFLAAALTLLMPDLQIAGFLMSESVVWPLSLWLIFFSGRLFLSEKKQFLSAVMAGIISSFLFWTKPGAIAMGVVLLFSALFLGEKAQLRKRRPAALVGFSVCVTLVICFYALYIFVFGYKPSFLGLYSKQLTTVSAVWYAAVAEFSLLQILLFAIAGGGVFFVLPFVSFAGFDNNRKQFLSAFFLGLAVTAVGTAALVDMYQWNGSFTNPQLHLRYMAMFIPVMVVFSLSAPLPDEKTKRLLLVSLGIMAALTVFPGASVGFVENESTSMDSLALSAYMPGILPSIVGLLITVTVVLFLVWVCLRIVCGRTSSLPKQSIAFFALFLLANNICGYVICSVHKDDSHFGSDAVQMNLLLEEQPGDVLIVTQQSYIEHLSYCLESRIRKPYQQVTVDALIEALAETDGVYVPFIPEDQSPNVGNHLTPDTDTFLFGAMVADHVEFSPSVTIQKSQNEWYSLVHVPKGDRIADTMLYGIDTRILHEGERARLYIFDESRFKNGKLSFTLLAQAEEESASLIIENAGRQQTLSLSSKPTLYKISLRYGDVVITSEGGNAVIFSYSTS